MMLCATCGESFESKAALIKHRVNYHPKATTFKCGKKEYRVIAGEKQGTFRCPKCNSQLSGMNNLRRHVGRRCRQSDEFDVSNDLEIISEQSERLDNGPDREQGKAIITENDCLHLDGLGFQVDQKWRVAVCTRCQYIVDPQKIISHILQVHRLTIPDIDQARRTIDAANLRPHLTVRSHSDSNDEDDEDDDNDDDNDDDDKTGFFPGSRAVTGLPVHAGFKCMICLNTYTVKASSMRSHIARHHPADKAAYTPVSVQVFYHRTTGQPQLSYVGVRQDEDESEAFCRAEPLGIPDDLDKLVGDHGFAVENRDRNQFGDKFGAYYCIETVVDFEDLSPWLLKPTAAGFRELMKLSVAYLDNCLKDVKAGFQPILAKIMQDDRKYEVAVMT
ncbi:hypothetical protein V1504DRAFT_479150 [Lipomyces starkeyi]